VIKAKKRAPGGGEFDSFGTPALFRGGMAFVAQISGTGDPMPKLFVRPGSRGRATAGRGRGVPGRPGGRLENFDPPDANESFVAFRATTDRAGNEGVFLASAKTFGLLVGTSDPAPDGQLFRGFAAPSLGKTRAYFLGRLIGATGAQSLYAVDAQ